MKLVIITSSYAILTLKHDYSRECDKMFFATYRKRTETIWSIGMF